MSPTPGQVAYEAFLAAWAPRSGPPVPWGDLPPLAHHAWEAAAQAVLARQEAPQARHPLTEGAVVRALTQLERGWPQDLLLFGGPHTLTLLRRRFFASPIPRKAVVKTFAIPADGGDPDWEEPHE